MGKVPKNKTPLKVYGYTVLYKKPEDAHWMVEPDEEIPVLPSHYDWIEMAADRVAFLRERGYLARSLALLAEFRDSLGTEETDNVSE